MFRMVPSTADSDEKSEKYKKIKGEIPVYGGIKPIIRVFPFDYKSGLFRFHEVPAT